MESAPSKAFQLLYWAEYFKENNIGENIISKAFDSGIMFNTSPKDNLSGNFDDLINIIQKAPKLHFLKNLQAIYHFISSESEMKTFFRAC